MSRGESWTLWVTSGRNHLIECSAWGVHWKGQQGQGTLEQAWDRETGKEEWKTGMLVDFRTSWFQGLSLWGNWSNNLLKVFWSEGTLTCPSQREQSVPVVFSVKQAIQQAIPQQKKNLGLTWGAILPEIRFLGRSQGHWEHSNFCCLVKWFLSYGAQGAAEMKTRNRFAHRQSWTILEQTLLNWAGPQYRVIVWLTSSTKTVSKEPILCRVCEPAWGWCSWAFGWSFRAKISLMCHNREHGGRLAARRQKKKNQILQIGR